MTDVCQISEFAGMATQVDGAPLAAVPPLTEQFVLITGVSTQSAAFSVNTRVLRLHTTNVCCLAFGPNPTAVSPTNFIMATNQTEYVRVTPGDKVAVIVFV